MKTAINKIVLHLYYYSVHFIKTLIRINQAKRDFSSCQRTPSGLTTKLKILYITPYSPYPPNMGASIRRYELIKQLGIHHPIVVASFAFYTSEFTVEQALDQHCDFALLVKNSPRFKPFTHRFLRSIAPFYSVRMRLLLHKLEKWQFDLVIFDSLYTAHYHRIFPHSFKILFEHNIESMIAERSLLFEQENIDVGVFQKKLQQVKLMKAYEEKCWSDFSLRVVVSVQDKEELDSRCARGETIVVKNGIDTINTVPVYNDSAQKILFMGMLAYAPNIDAINYLTAHILPLIWAKEPDLIFCIAGRAPTPEILELNKQSGIEVIDGPDDMSEVAKACRMTLVPLRIGGGTRIKILHSMAMGLPVISTSIGAEGLDVTDNVNILLRNQPEEFAQAVLQLNSDHALSQRLSNMGRQFVEREYAWATIYRQMEQEIIQRLPPHKTESTLL